MALPPPDAVKSSKGCSLPVVQTTPVRPLLPANEAPRPTWPVTTSIPQQLGARSWAWCRSAGREAWADLRAAQWRRLALWLLLLVWIVALVVGIALLSTWTTHGVLDTACRPDGSFSPFAGYSFWDMSGFFQITLPFGILTFGQAKTVDIAWDLVSHCYDGSGLGPYCKPVARFLTCSRSWAEAARPCWHSTPTEHSPHM